jgi:2-polyprenyl-3-methyl-5-hydroxy-6-metoxy-1,4-benzoquinol methylase
MACPLCAASDTADYYRDRVRAYRQCRLCLLIFVPRDYHLSAGAEKAEYDKHRNSITDPGYRRFLQRLAQPLSERLPPACTGLDFGCGPGPALADILRGAGFTIECYDPYYYPDRRPLQQRYDFITATEVIEHLAHPREELPRLWQLLRPGGILGLMTKLVIDRSRFSRWHYIRDPTHIAFYSRYTMVYIATMLEADIEFIDNDVMLLCKR